VPDARIPYQAPEMLGISATSRNIVLFAGILVLVFVEVTGVAVAIVSSLSDGL
jgi:hypothetical protein